MKKSLVLQWAFLALAGTIAPAYAKTFELPQKEPLFSITFPDDWEAEAKRDEIAARLNGSDLLFSIFQLKTAKTPADALALVTQRAGETYKKIEIDNTSQSALNDMPASLAKGAAQLHGVTVNIYLRAFTPDHIHYFGFYWATEPATAEKHWRKAAEIFNSITDNLSFAFPKQTPAFTIKVPSAVAVEQGAEHIAFKLRKPLPNITKSSLFFALIPAEDKVTSRETAEAWLQKKATVLLKNAGLEHGKPNEFGERISNSAVDMSLTARYEDPGNNNALQVWVFTPDQHRYFYASGLSNELSVGETERGEWWGLTVLSSIEPVR